MCGAESSLTSETLVWEQKSCFQHESQSAHRHNYYMKIFTTTDEKDQEWNSDPLVLSFASGFTGALKFLPQIFT